MEQLRFKFESLDYQQSKINVMKKALFLAILIFTICLVSTSEYLISGLIGLFVFGVIFFKMTKTIRYNIEEIRFGRMIDVTFTYKGKSKVEVVAAESIVFEKIYGFSKTKQPILKVILIDLGISINQYEIGGWKEEDMDKVIMAYNKTQVKI